MTALRQEPAFEVSGSNFRCTLQSGLTQQLGHVREVPTADQFSRQQSGDCRSELFYPEDEITRVGLAIRIPRQRGLEAQPFVETMRGRQDFVAGQALLIASRAKDEFDQFLCDGTTDPTTSIG